MLHAGVWTHFHGGNTGSNPVCATNADSTTYGPFSRWRIFHARHLGVTRGRFLALFVVAEPFGLDSHQIIDDGPQRALCQVRVAPSHALKRMPKHLGDVALRVS